MFVLAVYCSLCRKLDLVELWNLAFILENNENDLK